jgi:hypothetical protein
MLEMIYLKCILIEQTISKSYLFVIVILLSQLIYLCLQLMHRCTPYYGMVGLSQVGALQVGHIMARAKKSCLTLKRLLDHCPMIIEHIVQ